MDDIKDQSAGRWQSILINLGMGANILTGKHSECPLCGRQKGFRFDDKDGSGSYICVCSAGKGVNLAIEYLGLDFVSAVKSIRSVLGISVEREVKAVDNAKELRKAKQRLGNIKKTCVKIERGSVVAEYFKNRGVLCGEAENIAHGQVPYYDDGEKVGLFDAVVSTIMNANGSPATLHVTYLGQDGFKLDCSAAKKVMPKVSDWKGGAIRLAPVRDGYLAIAEGIETALAVTTHDGLPCWAAVTAGNMEAVIIPSEVTHLFIYADSDKSFTGQAAAYSLAKRLMNKNRELNVTVMLITDDIFADSGSDRDYLDYVGG